MKKLGLLILSVVAIIGGLLIVFKDKIFGELKETSEENKGIGTGATTASTMVSTAPNVVYVTQSVSGTAIVGSIRVTNAGTIDSGKLFYKVENVGTADGTINTGKGVRVLKPTEYVTYNQALNPSVKPAGSVVYDATGTEFIIDTVDA